MTDVFPNRRAAGAALAERLSRYADTDDLVVLGLPRGGVPVADEVARTLRVPLDVFVVRKLGVPGHEELAFGAIASEGVRVLNEDVVGAARLRPEDIEMVAAREAAEVERRERLYRGGREPLHLRGRTAIVVDDGLATGATMRAAVAALRGMGATGIVVAVPTAAPQTCADLGGAADEIVCVLTPDPFVAVSLWYLDFPQVSDEEVRQLLEQAAGAR